LGEKTGWRFPMKQPPDIQRSMLVGLVMRARRGGRTKEGQRWGWRSLACADRMAASSEEGPGGRRCEGRTGRGRGRWDTDGGVCSVGGQARLRPAGRGEGNPGQCRGRGLLATERYVSTGVKSRELNFCFGRFCGSFRNTSAWSGSRQSDAGTNRICSGRVEFRLLEDRIIAVVTAVSFAVGSFYHWCL
jgi:hypothetical protein